MSDQLTPPTGGLGALRVVAVVAACVGVIALVAGAFVFSYPGLHAVALEARVSPRLAKGYPLMFDALLVVAMPAALALRSAGWSSRLLAWVILLALLCAAAGADAFHAAGGHLKARPAAITAAILPWALVLIAFVLLLMVLQHSRARRQSAERASLPVSLFEAAESSGYAQSSAQSLVPGFPAPALLPAETTTQDEQMGAPVALAGTTTQGKDLGAPVPLAETTTQGKDFGPPVPLAETTTQGKDFGPPVPLAEATTEGEDFGPPASPAETTTDDDDVYLVEVTTLDENVGPAQPPDEPAAIDDGPAVVTPPDDDDPEMPVFHRAWSAPVPPGDTAD